MKHTEHPKPANGDKSASGDKSKPLFRLPLLEAFDYLYKNNLAIDDLWTVTGEDGLPQTNITTKPTLHPKT